MALKSFASGRPVAVLRYVLIALACHEGCTAESTPLSYVSACLGSGPLSAEPIECAIAMERVLRRSGGPQCG